MIKVVGINKSKKGRKSKCQEREEQGLINAEEGDQQGLSNSFVW